MTDNRQKEDSNTRKADIGIVLSRAEILRLSNAGQKSKDKRAALHPSVQAMATTGDSAEQNRTTKQHEKEDSTKQREGEQNYTTPPSKAVREEKRTSSSNGADP
ncbi:hypothetical protein BDV32DRAFT_146315 [Aspergillus pseudonomiae]|uniref:Uncharacterized protein n=1 Tax=Aspergillus pseudonomiae TaxID=1506151 RepID=A0A5N6IBR6_9EURO|nr:uncharacterized protein BDV37DRAFT_278850 [Aspergillus pseudonomiae]KAB8263497.1 hypothetical protein BDV32DRAFT_146315 [Aspergillus pseudonomiae]KAE8408359.1 hypothetical protein BDV37DRAFT_278850 [Aspergillus pseudonomiae]